MTLQAGTDSACATANFNFDDTTPGTLMSRRVVVPFPVGCASQTLLVSALEDVDGLDETLAFSLVEESASYAVTSTPGGAVRTLTVTDNEPEAMLFVRGGLRSSLVQDVIIEGGGLIVSVVIPDYVVGTATPVTVNFAVSGDIDDGDANSRTDVLFRPTGLPLTEFSELVVDGIDIGFDNEGRPLSSFDPNNNPGEPGALMRFRAILDLIEEDDETVTVMLLAGDGYRLPATDNSRSLTIIDTLRVTIPGPAERTAVEGGAAVTMTLQLHRAIRQDLRETVIALMQIRPLPMGEYRVDSVETDVTFNEGNHEVFFPARDSRDRITVRITALEDSDSDDEVIRLRVPNIFTLSFSATGGIGFSYPQIPVPEVTIILEDNDVGAALAGTLTANNLNGSTVTVTLANTEYVSGDLTAAAFILMTDLSGLTVSDVTRDSVTRATLMLAYSGEDFTADATLSVTVPESAHIRPNSLTTNELVIIGNTAPIFTPATIASQTYAVGVVIDDLILPVAAGGNGTLTYTLAPALPDGLTFDVRGFEISGRPESAQLATAYLYSVSDSDSDVSAPDRDTITFTITINENLINGVTQGSVVERGALNPAAVETATGTLTLDADTFTRQDGMIDRARGLGTYGRFELTESGEWTYTLDNASPVTNALVADEEVTERFIVVSASDIGVRRKVIITITGANDAPIAVIDEAPTLTVVAGGSAMLTGTGSRDPDADDNVETYAWQVVTDGTPSLSLSTIDRATLSFTAPTATTQQAYTIGLIVNDGEVNSFLSTVMVTVIPDTPPALDETIDDQIYTVGTDIGETILPLAVGGNGALIYTLAPALPGGLTFDADNRRITGTPEQPQDASLYIYTARDSDLNDAVSDSSSLSFTIQIDASPIEITGNFTGAVTERGALNPDQTETAVGALTLLSGTFTAQDGTTDRAGGRGTYGTFELTAEGEWIYTLDNNDPDTNSLAADVSRTDAFNAVLALAATTSQAITITVIGANDAPTADVGNPQSVNEDDGTVTLTGTGTDPDAGDQVSLIYRWEQTEGMPPVTLTDANTPVTAFSIPTDLTESTDLTFRLTVTDSSLATATATVIISINADDDEAIIAGDLSGNVTERGSVTEDALTTATGTLTAADPDGDDNIFQLEPGVSGMYGDFSLTTAGAWIYTLDNERLATNVLASDAVVIDDFIVRSFDTTMETVIITVTGANDAPTAEAGPAQTVARGDQATLDGSGSFDPDTGDSIATYVWRQVGDPATEQVTLVTSTFSAIATFTAPNVDTDTVLIFELVVNDGDVDSLPSTVMVIVSPDTPPAFDIASIADQSYTVGVSITALQLPPASGGNGALIYTLAPTLPDGLIFDAQGLEINGRPESVQTATTYIYTVSDSDSNAAPSDMDTITFMITINANLINGVTEGSVAERGASNPAAAETVTGTLTLDTDTFTSQNGMIDRAGGLGSYGRFELTESGDWTYTLDNAAPDTNALAAGEEVTEVFTAVSVSDGGVLREVIITITGANDAPVADAGLDRNVISDSMAMLLGSGSDPEDTSDLLVYEWEQTDGESVTLSSTVVATPTFVAPTVATATDLMFTLTVTDTSGVTGTATVTLTVLAPELPVVSLVPGSDTLVEGGSAIRLVVSLDVVAPAAGVQVQLDSLQTVPSVTPERVTYGLDYRVRLEFLSSTDLACLPFDFSFDETTPDTLMSRRVVVPFPAGCASQTLLVSALEDVDGLDETLTFSLVEEGDSYAVTLVPDEAVRALTVTDNEPMVTLGVLGDPTVPILRGVVTELNRLAVEIFFMGPVTVPPLTVNVAVSGDIDDGDVSRDFDFDAVDSSFLPTGDSLAGLSELAIDTAIFNTLSRGQESFVVIPDGIEEGRGDGNCDAAGGQRLPAVGDRQQPQRHDTGLAECDHPGHHRAHRR